MTTLTDEMIRRERAEFDRLEKAYERLQLTSDDLWVRLENKRALLSALGHDVDDEDDGDEGVKA